MKLTMLVVVPAATIALALVVRRSERMNETDKGVIGIILVIFSIVMVALV